MNEIAFVIASYEFGAGRAEGLEPVVDGVSLVDLFAQADGEISYAGLVPPEPFLRRWRNVLAAGGAAELKLLGCACGDSDCSWAKAQAEVDEDTVTWSEFWGSSPAGEAGPRRYADIGRYRFARTQYAAALATPLFAEAPVRMKPDISALRSGIPSNPGAWLKEMTLAFGRDFHTATQPEPVKELAAAGLRSLANAGHPMTAEVVREWARDRRYTEEDAERCVERFREIGGL